MAARPAAGAPRQANLRRAISSAYYGLFHLVMTALADEFVGNRHRRSSRYTLVYRSVDHRALKALCLDIRRPVLPARHASYWAAGGVGDNLRAFATVAVDLQEQRHAADYDPRTRFNISETKLLIDTAAGAARRFGLINPARRKLFLTLLLCPPRP